MKNHLLTALIALVCGFAGAGLWSLSGLGHNQTRNYLLSNPQILPDMAEAYQREQAKDRLAQAPDGVKQPFPGAVLGNPEIRYQARPLPPRPGQHHQNAHHANHQAFRILQGGRLHRGQPALLTRLFHARPRPRRG